MKCICVHNVLTTIIISIANCSIEIRIILGFQGIRQDVSYPRAGDTCTIKPIIKRLANIYIPNLHSQSKYFFILLAQISFINGFTVHSLFFRSCHIIFFDVPTTYLIHGYFTCSVFLIVLCCVSLSIRLTLYL